MHKSFFEINLSYYKEYHDFDISLLLFHINSKFKASIFLEFVLSGVFFCDILSNWLIVRFLSFKYHNT